MNTKLSKDHKTVNKWDEILNPSTNEDEIKHEAQMLMFSFISEIEKYQELQDITRKELSKRIKTSPSYITQVFRGDKPLNLETLAKIQSALNITFHVHARPKAEEMVVNEKIFLENTQCRFKAGKGAWFWKNLKQENPDKNIYEFDEDNNLMESFLETYESNAFSA